jgi:transposase
MGEIRMIGLDVEKHVFQAHGADESGAVQFRKRLRRVQVLSFFAAQPPRTVAVEARGRSPHSAMTCGRERIWPSLSRRLPDPSF